MRIAPALLLVSSALCTAPAWAQTQIYCCNDAAGRRVCGDFLPTECQSRAYEERDGKGFVTARKDAPLSAEQQVRRNAELEKKRDEEKRKLEERRRSQALLSTYSSDKDIDAARDRALVDVDKVITQAEKRLAEAMASKSKVDKDKEFYKNKALPPALKAQMTEVDSQITTQQEAVAAKKRDREAMIAKFEDERKRYHELKGDTPATKKEITATPTAAEPAVEAKPAEKK